MSVFSAINLDRLPAPQIIAQPEFEEIFEARKARLLELAQTHGNAEELAGIQEALSLESSALTLLLQEDSYREVILRQEIQEAGKGSLLAFARGAALDHLGALYGLERLIVQAADPTTTPPLAEILESDDRFRARIQLAPEGFTNAGSVGSYLYWALSASADVKNVAILEDTPPGEVHIVVLSIYGNGEASDALIDLVRHKLNAEEIRSVCDLVFVQGAEIKPYSVQAELTFFDGPDPALIREAAHAALVEYADDQHRLGHSIALSGIYSALHQEGVRHVKLISPSSDISIATHQAGFCEGITLLDGGDNE